MDFEPAEPARRKNGEDGKPGADVRCRVDADPALGEAGANLVGWTRDRMGKALSGWRKVGGWPTEARLEIEVKLRVVG